MLMMSKVQSVLLLLLWIATTTTLFSVYSLAHGEFFSPNTGWAQQPLVYLTSGTVLGTTMVTDNGTEIFAFLGVPYAEPPLGNLRFRFPLRKKPWRGIWNATQNTSPCVQYAGETYDISGDENCLHLNIYTPKDWRRGRLLRPVMVYFHGGVYLFQSAQTTTFGPQRLMDYGIVLVTVYYRLGPLGFLNTQDKAAVGNYGLKDQIAALRWVQEHIRMFGGDPSRVLIFGQSVGAFSSMLHMVSPLGKKLFNAVIAESGAITNRRFTTSDPKTWATALGQRLQCPLTNSFRLVACLRKKSAYDITKALVELELLKDFNERTRFQVTLENYTRVTKETYLPVDPIDKMKQGNFIKVPIIIGVNQDEGYFHYSLNSGIYDAFGPKHLDILPENVMKFLPEFERFGTDVVFGAIWKEYFSTIDQMSDEEIEDTIIQVYNDISYSRNADDTVDLLTSNGISPYVYKFTYANQPKYKGLVSHADELQYLFRTDLYPNNLILSGDDRIVSQNFLSLWTSFAKSKTNVPTSSNVKWLPSTTSDRRYLNISTNLSMVSGFLNDRAHFWRRGIYDYISSQINY